MHFRFLFICSVFNGEFRQYRGPRDSESLIEFIEELKWKDIEPVSAWKHPDSIQMAIVSYFFKLSHYLKEVNNVMLTDYGMPPWLTYVAFAIVTILFGALLGLILVSIIDLIFPPVSLNSRKSFSQGEGNAASTDEDARDVIEDDGETEPSAAVPANDEEDDEEEAPSTSEGEKFSGSDSDESSEDDKGVGREYIKKIFKFHDSFDNEFVFWIRFRNWCEEITKIITRSSETQAPKSGLNGIKSH